MRKGQTSLLKTIRSARGNTRFPRPSLNYYFFFSAFMYAYDDVVIKDGHAYYRKIYYYEGCVFIHTKTKLNKAGG